MTPSRIHGIVLAGGRSSRMGADKALLAVAGKPLLRRIADILQDYCDGVTVVLPYSEPNRYAGILAPGTGLASDREPGLGPLAGLHAGLSALPEGTDWAFVMACDMPLFDPGLFRRMAAALPDTENPDSMAVLCPGQPFHAMYHRSAADAAAGLLDERRLKLMRWIDSLRPVYVAPPQEDIFLNLNTPEEYSAFLRSFDPDC